MNNDLMTLAEAAVMLGMPEGSVYKLTDSRVLDSHVVDGMIMVSNQDVLDYINNMENLDE